MNPYSPSLKIAENRHDTIFESNSPGVQNKFPYITVHNQSTCVPGGVEFIRHIAKHAIASEELVGKVFFLQHGTDVVRHVVHLLRERLGIGSVGMRPGRKVRYSL